MDHSKFMRWWLFAATTICLGLFFFRFYYTNRPGYIFLIWNLFLAFSPLIWIELIREFLPWNNLFSKGILFAGWLILFPNAPYILTDLMHLKGTGHLIPIWYDVFLIFSFAFTGIVAGFYGLNKIRKLFAPEFSAKTLNRLTIFVLFLSAFGIYLGRFLRWNSWDILHHPGVLFHDIFDRFIHPFEHPRTWAVTIIFGILLNLFYWLMNRHQSSKTNLNNR